jgi:hypothetical protein
LIADLPLALALQHVEGFFLNTMDMKAGGKAGRHCPIEHAGVSGILSGHEERHRLAGQRNFLALTRHSDNGFCVHDGSPWCDASSCRRNLRNMIPPTPKVVNSFRNRCKIFPNGAN